MTSYTRYIGLLLMGATALSAFAQLDQSIAVDGKYTPEIIRLDRINAFPRAERFELPTSPLLYDDKGVPASFAPSLTSMPASGWRDTRKISRHRGYLELGMGSWLNSTLSAGYRFVDSPSTVIGIRLQHNSTSLWKPEVSERASDTKMWRYDESLGVYGSHIFDGKGRLDAAVDYHIGNFNYYGIRHFLMDSGPIPPPVVPTQTLNDVSARVGWTSPSTPDNLQWNVAAGVRYFGYRSFYDVFYRAGWYQPDRLSRVSSTRETDINIEGGLTFPLSSKSAIGIDLTADVLAYGGYKADSEDMPLAPDTYGLVTLTPYYRFSISRLNLRLGLDIDLAANAGMKDNRYGAFHVAPAVRLDYDAGPARLYLHALGGSQLHTLAGGYELDYYQQPFLSDTRPVYTPLDGKFGASFGPFSGFSAGVDFAFRISRGEYLGGWYMSMISRPFGAFPEGLRHTMDQYMLHYSFYADQTMNLHGYSIGANLKYDLGRLFSIEASGRYQPQKGTTGFFNGLDRPRITARASVSSNPWKTLRLSLAYDYRGVRNCYTNATYYPETNMPVSMPVAYRLSDITSLGFGASYGITDNVSVWLQADNLLNRHTPLLPFQPQQGVTFAGGLSWLFD